MSTSDQPGGSEPPVLLTLTSTVALYVWPPLVPVIVSGYVPPAVPLAAVTVRVVPAGGVMLELPKFADIPEGIPLTLSATLPLKPADANELMENVVAAPPAVMVWAYGAPATQNGFVMPLIQSV